MSKFLEVLSGIKARRDTLWNALPTFFERLAPYFPGIQRRIYTIITASSGVGKSKLARELFIYGPLRFLEQHPECPIKYKPFYFSYEETLEEFVLNGILSRLWEIDGISLDMMTLMGVGVRRHLLTEEVLEKIAEHQAYFDDLLTKVTFVDTPTTRNPTGVYMYMKAYAWENGKYFLNGVHVTDQAGKWDEYIPNDPNELVQIIVDHYALFTPEKRDGRPMNLMETIEFFSNHYAIHFRNKLGYSVCGVQQQAADKERVESNYKGQTIEGKLEPSLDGLGDSKKTQRDANYVLGLFAPNRYELPKHRDYDITLLQDFYRSLSILKARSAPSGARIGIYMNGATNTFEELPPAKDMVDIMSGEPDPGKYKKYLPQK